MALRSITPRSLSGPGASPTFSYRKRHGPDIAANVRLKLDLGLLDVGTAYAELPPGCAGIIALAPGWRQGHVVATRQRDADQQAENRPPMVSASGAGRAAMLH